MFANDQPGCVMYSQLGAKSSQNKSAILFCKKHRLMVKVGLILKDLPLWLLAVLKKKKRLNMSWLDRLELKYSNYY